MELKYLVLVNNELQTQAIFIIIHSIILASLYLDFYKFSIRLILIMFCR